MRSLFSDVRNRVVPALLTAAGIALVAAGLLSYSTPVDAGPPGASDGIADATDTPTATIGLFTIPPLTTPTPGSSTAASPSPTLTPADRVATRVVITALDIDLPVVKPPSGFPYCDVAMYFDHKTTPGVPFVQPGQTGAVYIFAHARTGMFLPLLTRSYTDNGSSMLGLLVSVYTSDDQQFIYKISTIHRHVFGLDLATLKVKDGQLWLQTSEGDAKTPATNGKLQVVAQFVSNVPASDADAHPTVHKRICS
jgi:hypothetical protein